MKLILSTTKVNREGCSPTWQREEVLASACSVCLAGWCVGCQTLGGPNSVVPIWFDYYVNSTCLINACKTIVQIGTINSLAITLVLNLPRARRTRFGTAPEESECVLRCGTSLSSFANHNVHIRTYIMYIMSPCLVFSQVFPVYTSTNISGIIESQWS